MRGDLLKQRREELNLSRDELASRVGVSWSQIRRYELEESDVTGDVLLKLAETLLCSTDYLLGKEDAEKPVYRLSDLSPQEQELIIAFRRGDLREAMQVLAQSGRLGSAQTK